MDNDIVEKHKAVIGDIVATCLLKKNYVRLDDEQVKALELTENEVKSLNEGNIFTQRHQSCNNTILIAVFHRWDGYYYIGAITDRQSPKSFFDGIQSFTANSHFPLV